MKFTLAWLKDHLDTSASVGEVAERLTMIGHEVESVTDRGAGLRDFVVAEVVAAERHPNADRLQVCVADTGLRQLQVVCGAPNARAGMKGVFAATGSYIPGIDVTLKPATIRGVESHGMLLSEREMGLSDDHAGIVELAADALVGAPAVQAMGLDDPLFDVAITPNRGDALGVRGLARDLAAAGLGTLKPLDLTPVPGQFASSVSVHLEFDADTRDACAFFAGRLIRGVQDQPSPKWLQDRLAAVGLRPISALVDITNYLTVDLCRPLHAFDADKLHGDLHVRLARPGETLTALNGRDYELDPSMTVIADDDAPEALGGVIGGTRTACTESTSSVFLESALFDPVRTATTGRRLNCLSDARFRFERGIDPSFVVSGLQIATRLVLELCGGEPSETIIVGAEPPRQASIRFRSEMLRSLTGVEIRAEQAERILRELGFVVEQAEDAWHVAPPPWRHDIIDVACLVEEIIRIHGYHHIPATILPASDGLPPPALNDAQRRHSLVRRLLASRGLIEAVTYSFVSDNAAEAFGGVRPELRLVNPISAELDVMRPSLLPNLIAAAARNADRGSRDVALFEVGPQYAGDSPQQQALVAAGIRSGRAGPRHWASPPRPVDAFDVKADALAALDALGIPTASLAVATETPAWYHPGRSAALRLGPKIVLAAFGEIHPRALRQLDARGPIAGFEVFLDALPVRKPTAGAGRPLLQLPPLQAVERDFAFVVDTTVAAEAVLKAVRAADKALITDAQVFDVFTGGNLEPGKKSLAIAVTLQPFEKTLTDAEIEATAQRIIAAVGKATGAVLRG